jgi:hypothetical protein
MYALAGPGRLYRKATHLSPGGKVEQERSIARDLPANPVWRTLATGIQSKHSRSVSSASQESSAAAAIQRKCAECEDDEKKSSAPLAPASAVVQRTPAAGLIMREPGCEELCGRNFEASSGDAAKRLAGLSACLHQCTPGSESQQQGPEQVPVAKNDAPTSDQPDQGGTPAAPSASGSKAQGDWTPPTGGPYPVEAMDPRVLKAPKTYQGNPPPPTGWRYWPVGKAIKPGAKKLAELGPKKEPGTFIQDMVAGELIGMRSEWHPFTVLFDKETHKPYNKPGLYKGGSLMVPVEPPKQPAAK